MYKSLRVKFALIFALMGLVAGGAALTPNLTFTQEEGVTFTVEEAAAAGTTDAWGASNNYSWFKGYANIYCPNGGCYGNLTVNVYYDGSWRAGTSSGYATWANKTIATNALTCGPSRFTHNLAVVATFSGGGYDRADYYIAIAC